MSVEFGDGTLWYSADRRPRSRRVGYFERFSTPHYFQVLADQTVWSLYLNAMYSFFIGSLALRKPGDVWRDIKMTSWPGDPISTATPFRSHTHSRTGHSLLLAPTRTHPKPRRCMEGY